MAAMSTALTEFSNYGDSFTYTTSGHTSSKPKLVLQKRKVPSGDQVVQESTVSVVQATENDSSEILPQKVTFSVTVRYPTSGQSTDVDAVLAIFRDVIAGDEFANVVDTQEPLV
jgi:hypothetical protein